MKTRKVILFAVVFVLIGATACLCARMKTSRKLGNPGVRLVAKPLFDIDGKMVRDQSVDLPEKILDMESKPSPLSLEELKILPADTMFGRRIYQAPDGFFLMTSVVVMGEDSRSIHKPEICLPSQGWKIDEEPKSIHMEKPVPYDLPVIRVIGSKTATTADGTIQPVKAVFVYWFVAEKDITADHVVRMWKMGKEMLRTGTLQRWSYIACIAYCSPGQEEMTYERIKSFITAAVPEFQLATGKDSRTASQTNPQTAFK